MLKWAFVSCSSHSLLYSNLQYSLGDLFKCSLSWFLNISLCSLFYYTLYMFYDTCFYCNHIYSLYSYVFPRKPFSSLFSAIAKPRLMITPVCFPTSSIVALIWRNPKCFTCARSLTTWLTFQGCWYKILLLHYLFRLCTCHIKICRSSENPSWIDVPFDSHIRTVMFVYSTETDYPTMCWRWW